MTNTLLYILFVCCGVVSGTGDECFANSCYKFVETGKTWTENQNSCKEKGGDLVSMETEGEWQFINDEIQQITLPGVNEWHIGLQNQGTWLWVSGKPLTINKWQRYEPSGDGNVAVMSKDYPPGSRGLFKDLNGLFSKAFICELPTAQDLTDVGDSGVLLVKESTQISQNALNISF